MSTPEYHQHEEFQNRSRKLAEMKALGIDPYPPKYLATRKAAELTAEMEGQEVGHSEDASQGNKLHACISGRIVLFRAMG
ncbi:MAG TPA: lysine--tRNA ligase, partial [Parachlamydiales bacterium]|nr:lysine--tRNA ligase [Parachlamydiales bacterium]